MHKHLDAIQNIAMQYDDSNLEDAVVEARDAFEKMIDEHAAETETLRARLVETESKLTVTAALAATPTTHRKRFPPDRSGYTVKFKVGTTEGYYTVNEFEDGTPGELFVTIERGGTHDRGVNDTIATLVSMALQHGVALTTLADKFIGTKFEPDGFTSHKDIRFATSIPDFLMRSLMIRYEPAVYFEKFPRAEVPVEGEVLEGEVAHG